MDLLSSLRRATVCCLMAACVAPAALAVGLPEYNLAELQPLGCEKMFIKLNTGLESCDAQAFYSSGCSTTRAPAWAVTQTRPRR